MKFLTPKQIRSSANDARMAALKADLHRQANGYLAASLAAGYWFEAIAIAESLISDRIESYLAKHHELNGINSLETNLKHLSSTVNLYKAEDLKMRLDLQNWKDQRNIAIHEIVKVRENESNDWHERLIHAKSTAIEGQDLASRVKNWSRRKP
jgi:hypothetical protein